jgi:hypothetical protein
MGCWKLKDHDFVVEHRRLGSLFIGESKTTKIKATSKLQARIIFRLKPESVGRTIVKIRMAEK